ncbi:MAG: DUF4373 domain-containing protein [Bacteroidales bacterium]|jgi:hypothetical protein|nr:DUF4373 domain-containing protein [Bacteroidales bacterium]
MAKTNKTGIDYFPLGVDFFLNDKIQFIENELGIKHEYVALRLLCKLYSERYYYRWRLDECLLFEKKIGVKDFSMRLVDEIVQGFFDKTLLNRFVILTSHEIQKNVFRSNKTI